MKLTFFDNLVLQESENRLGNGVETITLEIVHQRDTKLLLVGSLDNLQERTDCLALCGLQVILFDKQTRGSALKRLHFKFGYPNMPWPDELLGGRFKRLGLDLNAEAEIILKGQHGQPLTLNTKDGERDPDINDMARYSCDKGNITTAHFMDGTKATFGYRQTGSVKVALPNALDNLQEHVSSTLFPQQVSDDIILKAQEMRRLNQGGGMKE